MKHLTDYEIQSYLQKSEPKKLTQMEDHLRICTACRKLVVLYERLGELVHSVPSEPTPKTFEKTVMQRLKRIRRQTRITDGIVAGVALVGLSISGAMVLLTPQLMEIVSDYFMDIWDYGIQLASGANGSIDALAVPFFGSILIMVLAAIDRLAMTRLGLDTKMQR